MNRTSKNEFDRELPLELHEPPINPLPHGRAFRGGKQPFIYLTSEKIEKHYTVNTGFWLKTKTKLA